MNDRINDLALCKAGAILMDLIMPDTENPDRINWNINCTKEHLVNFADLIIMECIRIAALDLNYNKNTEKLIKDYFGLLNEQPSEKI